jgi:fucose 4-O-acetylase-like acetyltransferase
MIDKQLSKSISLLRLPLSLLIVFGHADIMKFPIYSHGNIALFSQTVISYPICLFSLVLFGSAVPLFFGISGYLFFNKPDFNTVIYRDKLKRRIKTLLIPYITWNIIYVLFNIMVLKSKGQTINIVSQIGSLWNMPNSSFPADPALWFVRDLMVCMVLTPIVYYIVKKKNVFAMFFMVFFSFWLTNAFSDKIIAGISISSLLFFSIGAFLAVNKTDIVNWLKTMGGGILLVWISLSILVLVLKEYPHYSTEELNEITPIVVIYRMANFIGCIVYIYLAIQIAGRCKVKDKNIDHSFIVFSCHMLVLMILRKCVEMIIPEVISPFTAFGIYFTYVLVSFSISYVASWLIHKNKIATQLFAGSR